MTTWENELYEGKELTVFNFEGLKVAILVCFDVEFPDIASRLKKENIDLLIVPSATETKLGYERVSRCASARAIELGCVVVTAHLIGKSENDMIDVNVGNHNIYYPSQSQFESYESKTHLLQTSGEVIQKFHLPINEVRNQRQLYNETNPCLKD
jgi:predicted amidohydrolase